MTSLHILLEARSAVPRTRRLRWTDACASVRARRDGSGSPIACGAQTRPGVGLSRDLMIGFARGSVDRLKQTIYHNAARSALEIAADSW